MFLASQDQVRAWIESYPPAAGTPARLLALHPTVRLFLDARGVRSEGTAPYFRRESHALCLEKAEYLRVWISQHFYFKDSLGLDLTYRSSLCWSARYLINNYLWLLELIHQTVHRWTPRALAGVEFDSPAACFPRLKLFESTLGVLLRRYAEVNAREFVPIRPLPVADVAREAAWARILERLVVPALRAMGRAVVSAQVRALGNRKRVLTGSGVLGRGKFGSDPGIDPEWAWLAMVDPVLLKPLHRRPSPDHLLQLLKSAVHGCGVMAGVRHLKGLDAGVPLDFFIDPGDVHPAESTDLESALDGFLEELRGETERFSHRDVGFGDLLADWMDRNLRPVMRDLLQRAHAVQRLVRAVRPSLIMAPHGRNTLGLLGEVGARSGVPRLLVSHGSHTPVKNEHEGRAWLPHAEGLLFSPAYNFGCFQTPLAERFASQVDSGGRYLRTGPVLWGGRMGRPCDTDLGRTIRQRWPSHRIVLHAGTYKPISGIHFWVYETPDEYVEALTDLIRAVETLDRVMMIVRLRDFDLTAHDLQRLLPKSDKVLFSMREPFAEVLPLADLLVSFSSTTIEEALQNGIPVVLYGGGGRYQHIEARPWNRGGPTTRTAVWSIASPDDLAAGIQGILASIPSVPVPRDWVRPYVYEAAEVVSQKNLLSLLGNGGGGVPEKFPIIHAASV